jgi:hypothetical protein
MNLRQRILVTIGFLAAALTGPATAGEVDHAAVGGNRE